jgi:hypothetical protein
MKIKIVLGLAALLLTASLATAAAEPPFTGLPTASLLCGANLLSASPVGDTLPLPTPLSPQVCSSCSSTDCVGKTFGADCKLGDHYGVCDPVNTCGVAFTYLCECSPPGQ